MKLKAPDFREVSAGNYKGNVTTLSITQTDLSSGGLSIQTQ
jgi:hypothetical protein